MSKACLLRPPALLSVLLFHRMTENVPSSSLEEQVARLSKRVRDGEVSQDSLQLAAYLGDPVACRVLGSRAPEVPSDPDVWLDSLSFPEIQIRVLVASCRARIASYENLLAQDAAMGSRRSMVQGWKDLLNAIEEYFFSRQNEQAFFIGETAVGLQEGIEEGLVSAQTGLVDYAGAMLSPVYQMALEVELELERMVLLLKLFMEPVDGPSHRLSPFRMEAVHAEVTPLILEGRDVLRERVQERIRSRMQRDTREDIGESME